MYKCVINLFVKISLMFAQYFDYYAIILKGGEGHSVYAVSYTHLTLPTKRIV